MKETFVMNKKYDFLIVGCGLFGCVCAEQLSKKGFKVLIIDKLGHIGGTCYTENVDGINVHKYGAHIFRTNDKAIFDYFSSFAEFNNFVNSPIAIYHNHAYNLPFNMNTFSQVWGVYDPNKVMEIINKDKKPDIKNPANLEEHAISLVGETIYKMFIKEYTEKQWGRSCTELPPDIIRRLPIRLTFDNNYYYDRYQGIPIGGYTNIFKKMIERCDVLLDEDFLLKKDHYKSIAKKIIYTGPIDEYFGCCFGMLQYRSLHFEEKRFPISNFQGNAVLNYTDSSVLYTRTIEHKHFEKVESDFTIVSYEYPKAWNPGDYPFYPVNDEINNSLYLRYVDLAKKETDVLFGGRLGQYKYYDMQDTIKAAMCLVKELIK